MVRPGMKRASRGFAARPRGMLGLLSGLAIVLGGVPAGAHAANVGHRDFTFTASEVVKPSGQKPQSKLWFNDGIWWGSLFKPSAAGDPANEYRIFQFDPAGQSWADTGTPLDARNSSEADTLWDGTHLYVASSSDLTTGGVLILRLSYNPATKTYSRDPGFPVTVASGAMEAVVLDKDTTGRLWITYTQGNTVFVAHTDGSDDAWGAPYALPFANAANLDPDDISAVVSYDGKIGVMWSNQTDDAMYFASHADGADDSAWSEQLARGGPFSSDDHINLKSVQSDPSGRVFAAIKTSNNDKPLPVDSEEQVVLLVLDGAGGWASHTFGTVADNHTRPIVLTDQQTRKLYMFATHGQPDTIVYKEASLDNPAFAPGAGTVFMSSGDGFDVNDASSTKQDLSQAPGLMVLASDLTNYWHNVLDLQHPPLPTATPSPSVVPVSTMVPPATPGAPRDRLAPGVGGLSLSPRAFRTRRRGSRRPGTTVRFRVSEPATVRLTVQRAAPGRRVGARCVRPTRANRSRARCTRYTTARGALLRHAPSGTNRIVWSGRLGGRSLAPGSYRLVLVATDAEGNASAPRRASFRILR